MIRSQVYLEQELKSSITINFDTCSTLCECEIYYSCVCMGVYGALGWLGCLLLCVVGWLGCRALSDDLPRNVSAIVVYLWVEVGCAVEYPLSL